MKIIISGLAAILMVACMVPVSVSEDSEALIGNSPDMSLDIDSAVIYVTGTPTSVVLTIDEVPDGYSASVANWTRHNIGDGIDCVSLSPSSGSSITVSSETLGNASVKSVEVVATIMVLNPDTMVSEPHTASAIIVVYPSPSTTATTFHYYLKVDTSAIPSGVTPQTTYNSNCPITYNNITNGIWIEVKQSDYTGLSPWNAMSAFQWYCDTYGISCHASGGWISDIINLSTYSGQNGVWYYWAQYHATTSVVNNETVNAWAFNNTTMSYITSVDSSYIGLIFWGSPNANTMPTFPGYPEANA